MAKINGIHTQIKGKAGNQVFQTWKGVQVLKTRVIPANPNTTGQQRTRENMRALVKFGKAILSDIIQPIWNASSFQAQSGWSKWLGVNQANQNFDWLDYGNISVSTGRLPVVLDLAFSYVSSTFTFSATWSANSAALNVSPKDYFHLLIFNSNDNTFYLCDRVSRDDEAVSLVLPASTNPDDLYSWLFGTQGELSVGSVGLASESQTTFIDIS